MKKTLLATTALVAFAGAAAAEIDISGSAEMGIVGGDARFGNIDDDGDRESATQFWTDVDVTFSMSGETDGGLAFGTSVDLDEAFDIDNNEIGEDDLRKGTGETDDADFNVFISGNFGTLTLGDTDGAMDFVLDDISSWGNPGTISDNETEHDGFFGSYHDGAGAYDGQILRYDNTFGGFTVAISAEQGERLDGDPDEEVEQSVAELDTAFAIGIGYDLDLGGTTLQLGLGYQSIDADAVGGLEDEDGNVEADESADIIGITAGAELDNGFQGGLTFVSGDIRGREDSNYIGLGLGYEINAISIHFNAGQFDFGNDDTETGYALAVGYDLGGGATILAGYAYSEDDPDDGDSEDFDDFSLGLSFSF